MSNAENIKALDDAKKLLDTSAQANRNLFIAYNTVLITVLILCLSITDEILLIGSSTITMPFLNVALPIWAFATIAPLFLVALHFDLLQNLNAHRDKVITWCRCWFKVHPETLSNSPMPKQLYPFLFDFAWVYNNHVEPKSSGIRMLPRLCWMLYCWSTYAVLIIFFVRFADLQHYGYSTWHLFLIFFDALLLDWYWAGFSTQPKPAAWQFVLAVVFVPLSFMPKILNHLNTTWQKLALLWFSNTVLMWSLILFTTIQLHIDFDTNPKLVKAALELEKVSYDYIGIRLVPRLTVPNFRVTLPDKFFAIEKLQQPDKSESQLWQDSKTPILNLSGRRFAFADLINAILPHTDLHDAKLQGADFETADLQATNLSRTNLQMARLWGCNLQTAQLISANLKTAILGSANLQTSDLGNANLQGADIKDANLQGARLSNAHLELVNLSNANLQGAMLKNAKLQAASLENANLQATSFAMANLQGVYFGNANLQATFLGGTLLKGVEFNNEQIANSWLLQPDWQTDYDFSELKKTPWAQEYPIKERIEDAEQRQKNFTPPKLPQTMDKEKFSSLWLGLLCKNETATKVMLKQLYRYGGHPVTKPQVRDYLNQHEECKPYRALLAND